MSTATQPAAQAALPDPLGPSAALPERPTTNNGHGATATAKRGSWQVVLLPVDRIDPNPWQPRTLFDETEMDELTQSVKAHGVQQPIIVRTAKPTPEESGGALKSRPKKTPHRYELVAGERRLRASAASGKTRIPAILRDDLSDLQVAEIALLENLQRANLSAIEEAKGYKRLMLDFRLSEERLAKKVGKSVGVVREMMKLLALPESVQQLIRQRKLTPAHGHELLRLCASPDACRSVAAYAVNNGLPATALARDVLPNWRELEKRGFLVPLDFRTRFDKSLCKTCPHKAHVSIGFAGYCLKPAEWKRKQDEALERQKDEHARVLEEARRQSEQPVSEGEAPKGEGESALVFLNQLERGSYRDLRFGETPGGCTGACPCRGCALDPYALSEAKAKEDASEAETEQAHVPICLNPERFRELQREERAKRDDERKHLFATRFEHALEHLLSVWDQGHREQALALVFTPFLDGRGTRSGYLPPGEWHRLFEQVAGKVGVALPIERLFDPETSESEVLRLLSGQAEEGENSVEPERLLLLGAGLLLLLEAQGAARWGGETPLLDFVLPPQSQAQTALALQEPDEAGAWDEEDDPFMEEDFASAAPHEQDMSFEQGEENLTEAALYQGATSELSA